MSEEDLVNKKTYISDFDITKHIVLDNESNYWYSAEYVDKMLKKQDKEIERLNNIINELEKWLKYKKEQMEEFELYKRKETGAFWYSTMGNIETFIERIQELKGSDK